MPEFLVLCDDDGDQTQARRTHLQAHLDYVESIAAGIRVAGPIVDSANGEYRASCFVYNAEDKGSALDMLHQDPYYRAGIFSTVRIEAFLPVAGTWVGGCSWLDS